MKSVHVLLAAAAMAAGAIASPASAVWQQATSEHFVVYADAPPATVEAFTTRLERFDRAMRVMRGIKDEPLSDAQRVTIYALDGLSDLQRLAKSDGIAGFYIPRASGAVAFVPLRDDLSDNAGSRTALSPQAVLQHEYSHHFMFSTWGDTVFPAWFIEGFAEFNATAKFTDTGVTVGGAPLYRSYAIAATNVVPMHDLLTDAAGGSLFYGRAWLLLHYLTFSPDTKGELRDYLGALSDGKSPEEAAKVFGNLAKLGSTLSNYATRKTLPSITLDNSILPVDKVTVRALDAGEAAVMPARMQSARGVGKKDAGEVYALASRLAQRFPDDPSAQAELAEAALDAKDYRAAEAAADRALAARPTMRQALMMRGLAGAQEAEKAGSTDASRWSAIRQFFVRANKLNGEDPWPLVAYYDSFVSAKQTPSAGAAQGLVYAQVLAPYDSDLTIEVADYRLTAGNTKEAKRLLTGIANNPHGGEKSKLAKSVIELIDKDDAKGAGAALAKGISDARAKEK